MTAHFTLGLSVSMGSPAPFSLAPPGDAGQEGQLVHQVEGDGGEGEQGTEGHLREMMVNREDWGLETRGLGIGRPLFNEPPFLGNQQWAAAP